MKETIYIFSNGRIRRKDNTLAFEMESGEKRFIPIENVNDIMIFGEVDINTKALNLLSQKEIVLHYFNYYGYYTGSFYPREHYNSGYMILKQAEHYLNEQERLFIAKQFIKGAAKNSLKILKYYNRRGRDLNEQIEEIERLIEELDKYQKVDKAMAIEGQIKQTYYEAFDRITENDDFSFGARSKRPPGNRINAMISFANSVIYTTCLSEIYKTHLDPRIGFLHTTNFRRFSLNLDIAEIFKPVIGDRVVLSLINRGEIKPNDFEKSLDGVFLKDAGKKKLIKAMDDKMKQTIKHSRLGRSVSYRRLIRLELYKLEKHLIGEEEYDPFVMEW